MQKLKPERYRSQEARGDKGMLRITVKENASEQRWVLQGRLTKHSIAELVSLWRATPDHHPARNRIVDLNEVTAIDKCGEEALCMMIDEGAKFIATGVYTKHLLEALHARTATSRNSD
jgi:ABC-type transporter Mla MlaB component